MTNELILAVAYYGFGIPNMDLKDKLASERPRKIANWLKNQPGISVEKIARFYAWYSINIPGYQQPRDLNKFIKFWQMFAEEES